MRFEGVFTALVTPFKNGRIDFEGLLRLAKIQCEAGVDGIVLTGTTGEAATLTMEEKTEIYSSVVKEFKGKIKIIAGTGDNNTLSTINNSISASKCGVDGLLVVTPYYNKPTQEGLYQHFKKVVTSVSLPIILYNVPGRTGCNIMPITVNRLAEFDGIVAIKEAGTFEQMNNMIAHNGSRISILSGDDFTFMPFMALGGHGVISVVSNIVPEKMIALYRSIKGNDLKKAREIHYLLYPLIEVLFVESNPGPVKAALKLREIIEDELRLPLVPPSDDSVMKIKNILSCLNLI